MSRSIWAWTDGRMPAGTAVCGAGERSGLEDQACLGRGPLFGVVSSTKRLVVLIAASVFLAGVAPASALAGSAGGSHANSPTHPNQQSADVAVAGAVVLAPGSGYSSRTGAARVRVLQRSLARAGFAPGPVDGLYGPLTEAAVSRYQAAHGLQVDGIAGPVTRAALNRPTVVLYPGAGYPTQTATRGRVRVLQRRLARAGYVPGPVDGRYGPLPKRR